LAVAVANILVRIIPTVPPGCANGGGERGVCVIFHVSVTGRGLWQGRSHGEYTAQDGGPSSGHVANKLVRIIPTVSPGHTRNSRRRECRDLL
jgi:hypothetical protein